MLTLIGALVLFLAYFLPFFQTRIASAHTTFIEDPAVTLEFPVLIHGQHATHAKTLGNGQLESVEVSLEKVNGVASTGWGWLFRSLGAPDRGALVSFIVTMAIPLVGAALGALLVVRSYVREAGVAEKLIPASLIMGAWFFASATGNFAAGLISAATGGEGGGVDRVMEVYSNVGWLAVGVGVAMLVIAPLVTRLMHLDTLRDDDLAGQAELADSQGAGLDITEERR